MRGNEEDGDGIKRGAYQQLRELGVELGLFRHRLGRRERLQVHHAVLVDDAVRDFRRLVLLRDARTEKTISIRMAK